MCYMQRRLSNNLPGYETQKMNPGTKPWLASLSGLLLLKELRIKVFKKPLVEMVHFWTSIGLQQLWYQVIIKDPISILFVTHCLFGESTMPQALGRPLVTLVLTTTWRKWNIASSKNNDDGQLCFFSSFVSTFRFYKQKTTIDLMTKETTWVWFCTSAARWDVQFSHWILIRKIISTKNWKETCWNSIHWLPTLNCCKIRKEFIACSHRPVVYCCKGPLSLDLSILQWESGWLSGWLQKSKNLDLWCDMNHFPYMKLFN